jgi:hypothetical protein
MGKATMMRERAKLLKVERDAALFDQLQGANPSSWVGSLVFQR